MIALKSCCFDVGNNEDFITWTCSPVKLLKNNSVDLYTGCLINAYHKNMIKAPSICKCVHLYEAKKKDGLLVLVRPTVILRPDPKRVFFQKVLFFFGEGNHPKTPKIVWKQLKQKGTIYKIGAKREKLCWCNKVVKTWKS